MNIPTEVRKVLEALVELKEPVLMLKGEVDVAMYDYVFWAVAALQAKGSPDLIIKIDSTGGSFDRGHDIYDLIILYKGKVTGIAISEVHSAASLILQACDVRCMTLHAQMCIHNPSRRSVSLDILESAAKTRKLRAELRAYQKRLVDAYGLRSNRSTRDIIVQLAKDKNMTSEEALAFGLIDKIVPIEFKS